MVEIHGNSKWYPRQQAQNNRSDYKTPTAFWPSGWTSRLPLGGKSLHKDNRGAGERGSWGAGNWAKPSATHVLVVAVNVSKA